MIIIDTNIGLSLQLDENTQTSEDYAATYDCLIAMIKDPIVTKVTASGVYLTRILELIGNIPRPIYPTSTGSFIWTGDFAKTIVANILNALYNDSSFVINTVEDFNEQRTELSLRSTD